MTKQAMYALYALGFLCASTGLAAAQGKPVISKGGIENSVQLVRQETRAEMAKYKAIKRFIRAYR